MSTVKRLSLVSNLPQEGSLHPVRAPPRWPTTGTVELQHLNACLRPGTPLALNNVSCIINPAEHVAFVGRSGCGKAAIPAAIFRIIESASGRIFIDGVNIATLGLRDLRSRLSHLPQDPVLFEGSVRSNLDPFENHTDSAIWEALDKVQLGDIVRALGSKLESEIQEDAQGWNLGLRQLFYLAKAILKRSPIIIIDEPKIPLDAEIDVIIKNILKEEFEDRTVIRIARHIPNAVKMSRVHVLENGMLVESDTPKALLENKESLFSKLLVEATIVSTKRAHGAIVMGHI